MGALQLMVVHSHIRKTGAASQVGRGVVWREQGMKGSVFGSMLSILSWVWEVTMHVQVYRNAGIIASACVSIQ